MKVSIARMLTICLLFLVTTVGCSKVPAGNVGIKVNLLGGEKGVETEELGVGRYWIGLNEELYVFPTFLQNYVWTQSATEGSEDDESIKFQTSNGMSVGADVGISYSIVAGKADELFQKYRKGVGEITDLYLRNMVRDAFVMEASLLTVQDIYGRGKTLFLENVQARVRNQVGDMLNVERIYLIGDLRLPEPIIAALNAKMAATQKAEQRRNEVQQAKAEADKKIEDARGIAESILRVARAEAEALELKAKVLRDNPALVNYEAIQKWDGALPQVNGSASLPMINLK